MYAPCHLPHASVPVVLGDVSPLDTASPAAPRYTVSVASISTGSIATDGPSYVCAGEFGIPLTLFPAVVVVVAYPGGGVPQLPPDPLPVSGFSMLFVPQLPPHVPLVESGNRDMSCVGSSESVLGLVAYGVVGPTGVAVLAVPNMLGVSIGCDSSRNG